MILPFSRNWNFSGLTQTMEIMEVNIPMFTYFDIYASNNKINYLFAELNMFQKDWNTTSEKK